MQIKVTTLAAISAAYIVGYSRGMTASKEIGNRIADGLNTVGEGFKDIAVQLGLDFKKYQEEKEEFNQTVVLNADLSTEEKITRMADHRDFYPSDERIAEKLGIPVEEVKTTLGENDLPDVEGEGTEAPKHEPAQIGQDQ